MPFPTETIDVFRRYQKIIESMIVGADTSFAPEAENATTVQVERGTIAVGELVNRNPARSATVDRLIELSASQRLSPLAVVDRGGHLRSVYRGLLVYSWLQAYRAAYETLPRDEFARWEEALRRWCDLLEAQLAGFDWADSGMPASRGAGAAETIWSALALHVAGKVFVRDAWTDLSSDAFGRLTRGQQANGCFLRTTSSDNPETHWYHELVLLHAAAGFAVQSEDRGVAAAVARAAEFHQNETQPDHASAQPWALFAFIWNPTTRPLADQVLHACSTQDPSARRGVSLMLLADCLYCLRLFM